MQKGLRMGLKEAKRRYKQNIEEHFNNKDSRCMWQGIKTILGYKDNSTASGPTDSTLPDTLNQFFAC